MNEESLRLRLHRPTQGGVGAAVEEEGEVPEQGLRTEELTREGVEGAGLG